MAYSSFSLLLIQLWIEFISCAVYHIIPSPSHHCPIDSCLTLSSFVADANLYLDSNTSLIFQPGSHVIHSKLNVSGVVNFSMTSVASQSRAGIICKNFTKPGFIFNATNHVHVSSLKFFECYCDTNCNSFDQGIKLFTLTASSLVLEKCIFQNNVGTGVITATNSNITIAQSTFKDNVRIKYEILKFISCNATVTSSTFIGNDGRLLLKFVRSYEIIMSTIPVASTLTITGSEFRNNNQSTGDGVIIVVSGSDAFLIYGTNFFSNKAAKILYTKKSIVNTDNCTFQYNQGSAMFIDNCKVDIFNSVFDRNKAGALRLQNSTIHIYGSEFQGNGRKGEGEGGAIHCMGETFISFYETCTFTSNQAEKGGAIYFAKRSRVQWFVAYGHGAAVVITNNSALNGGGIYLNDTNLTLHSQSTLQIFNNWATQNGGGIYVSEYSFINLSFKLFNQSSNFTSIYFHRNRARNGGGLYLELSSIVTLPCLNNVIEFDKNSADYGGAVYVYTAAEFSGQYHFPECFFQSETLQNPAVMKCKPIWFSSNRVNYSEFQDLVCTRRLLTIVQWVEGHLKNSNFSGL